MFDKAFWTLVRLIKSSFSHMKTYVDNAIITATIGLFDDRGVYDASGNTFPASGGSGTAGAILKGDIWTISVAGTLGGIAVKVGDTVRALCDTPAQTASNWAIMEMELGYVPVNKAGDTMTGDLAISKATPKLTLTEASGRAAYMQRLATANEHKLVNNVAKQGANGQALKITSNSSTVATIANPSTFGLSGFTCCFYVTRHSDFSQVNYSMIVSFANLPTTNQILDIGMHADGSIIVYSPAGGWVESNVIVSAGETACIMVWITGGKVYISKNDGAASSYTFSATGTPTNGYIGWASGSGNVAPAIQLDEMRWYNTALSSLQRTEYYGAGAGRYTEVSGATAEAMWHFDNNGTDSSGNSHTVVPNANFSYVTGTILVPGTYNDQQYLSCLDGVNAGEGGIIKLGNPSDSSLSIIPYCMAAKATPIDADSDVIVDSADGNRMKLSTWTNIKAFLKTYFDTVYQTVNTAILKSLLTTRGDIIVADATPTPTRKAVGTVGKVFVSDGTDPDWGSLDPTGGTITTVGGNRIHTFTASGNFVNKGTTKWITYLLVAGGGGGGGAHTGGYAGSGGGGAGGLLTGSVAVAIGTFAIVVGAGGSAGTANTGSNGNDSTALTLTAITGGGGGHADLSTGYNGLDGGSGGGASYHPGVGAGTGGSGTVGQGYAGGNAPANDGAGGGGGASAVGADGNGTRIGGAGTASSITGASVTYAGGGGGGMYSNGAGAIGGAGGGGQAGDNSDSTGHAGTDGLGGGGGGSWGSASGGNSTGGDGGDGVVILSYAI